MYTDLIRDKYPEKEAICQKYIRKQQWIALDVIQINDILFGSNKSKFSKIIDQKHRAYDLTSILCILKDQRENGLNNNETANKYGLSRNTLAKWKKYFENNTDNM